MLGIIWIKEIIIKKVHTSAGTIGALTAEAASSPFTAPKTALAISIATPGVDTSFCNRKMHKTCNR
jgi:hypothetical protein